MRIRIRKPSSRNRVYQYGMGVVDKGKQLRKKHVRAGIAFGAILIAAVGGGLYMHMSSPVQANLSNVVAGKWNFDEGSGTTVADSSGNSLNGTLTQSSGSPTWTSPGRDGTGSALQFNGSGPLATASSNVNLGNNAALDAMPSYILSVWAKFEPGYVGPCGGNGYANLIGRNSDGFNWSYMMYIRSDGRVRVHHRQSDGAPKLYDSAAVVPTGQWVHLEQVADGNRLRLFINGVEDTNSSTAAASNTYNGTGLSLPSANTYIGQDNRECAPNGTIDDASIYTPFVAPGGVYGGLVAWHKANDGVSNSTTWHDSSDNGLWATGGAGIFSPTLVSSGVNFNPSFYYDGVDRFFIPSRLNISGTNSFQGFAVAKQDTAGNGAINAANGANNTDNVTTLLNPDGTFRLSESGIPSAGTSCAAQTPNSLPAGNAGVMSWARSSTSANGASVQLNGGTAGTGTCNINISAVNNRIYGYRSQQGESTQALIGHLPEAVHYSRALSATESRQVQSYLAVKYGATLAGNYLASDGTTTIWNATTNAGYANNVTGIGRDDVSVLSQKQSKSQNAGALVTMGHGNTIAATNVANTNNFTDNKDFLLFGDDNGGLTWTGTGAPAGRQKLARTFKVQNTGSVGSVKLQVPDNGSALATELPEEITNLYLLVDSDNDFSSGATSVPMTLNGTNWEADSAFADGSYFTFATDIMPPPDMTAATDSGSSNTDNITNDTTPTFTGTCLTGQTVTLRIDGAAVVPTAVCAASAYTITPSAPIAEGNHTITAGDPESAALAFTIDTTEPAPPAPNLTPETDSGASNTDNITNEFAPIFDGNCTDGKTVTLYVDGAATGSTTCAGGIYLLVASGLADGVRTIAVTQGVDVAGNTSSQSAALNVTIDRAPPAAPVITGPANGAVTSDTTPAFSGTGEEGASVTVTDTSDAVVCQAAVSGGAWTCSPAAPLPDGAFGFKANQIDIAGNVGPNSPVSTVTIDTSLPVAPVVIAPANGARTSDNTPAITGTGIPDATVHLVIDGGTPVDVSVDGAGNWTYTPLAPLAEGPHDVVATQTNAAGTTSGVSNTNNFTIDTAAPAAPVIISPTNGEELTDNTPNVVGTGEPYAEVTVKDEKGNILCTATVDSVGNWSCISAALAEGTHMLTATQTDRAGNVSDPSASTTVTVKVDTDGALAATEDAAPNGGDGNGDGVMDSEQGNVTSVPNPVTGGYVTLEVTGSACGLTREFAAVAESSLPAQEDRTYPVGLFDYTFDCYGTGKQATVKVYLDKQYDTSKWEWRKFSTPTKQYSTMQPLVTYGTATVGGTPVTTATYSVTDGDALDEDGSANASFTDPSGPAEVIPPAAANTSAGGLADTGRNIGLASGAAISLIAGAVAVIRKKKLASSSSRR